MFTKLVESRFDPFSKDLVHVRVEGESHVIPNDSPHWVRLNEVPIEELPSAFYIPGFREVYTSPTSGFYRVDYTYGTGLVEFHSDNKNESIEVTYRGVGTNLSDTVMNVFIDGRPEESSIAGDWVGTHFPVAVDQFAADDGWDINTPIGSGGELEHEWHKVTFVRSPTPSDSTDAVISVTNSRISHACRWGGITSFQFRLRALTNTYAASGAFFAYFGRHPREGADTAAARYYDMSALEVTGDGVTKFPGWGILPVGFGWTNAGTKYFCTFARSVYFSHVNTLRWAAGVAGYTSSSLPNTDSLALSGGHITNVNTFFSGTETDWHSIQIDLADNFARVYIDGVLAALHTTNIPGTPYGLEQEAYKPTLQAFMPQVTAPDYYGFEVDYFSVGYTDQPRKVWPTSPAVFANPVPQVAESDSGL